MPYHLLYETQAAKDRLFAHHTQATCMAPVPFPQQQQHSTLSKSTTDAAPIAPSQLPASHDALHTATSPPHPPAPPAPPQQQQALKNTLLAPHPILPTTPLTLNEPLSPISSPQPPTPRALSLSPTRSPLLLISLFILIFILLVTLEFRFLEAHASLFDRLDNWFRRFHKGTSKFRHRHQQPAGRENQQEARSASGLEDSETTKRKATRKRRGFIAPGFALKTLLVSVGDSLTRAIRRIMEGPGGRDLVVRSFEGIPVATRPWELPLPQMTAAPISETQPSWITESAAPQILYGVPPAIKPVRARRTTIASRVLEPEAAVEGEGHGSASEVMSVLRQQAMADDEARGTVDPLMMRVPRGEDGREERDLEAAEGRGVRVRGWEEKLAVRRGWGGEVGAGGEIV